MVGCTSVIISYRLLSSKLDSIVKTLVAIGHKTLKKLKEEIVDNDEKLNIVNDKENIIKEDMYINDSMKDLNKIIQIEL